MRKSISNILTGVVGMSAAAVLWSCSAENPFDSEGTGTVQLRTVVNSLTTRAAEYSQEDLENNCVVYVSGDNGLVYKHKGLSDIASQITLKSGHYVAEAWTGDSVTASFDKKFFRGYQPFDVTKGSTSNVVVNCRIANVVASVNTSTIDPNLMNDDYVIEIKNSRGSLTFTKDNAVSEKAYFMMPNGDTTLEYTISGTRKDGKSFTKTGTITNVERAHHYILNFEYNGNPEDPSQGAVFIQITIKDEEIEDSKDMIVKARPTLSGFGFDLEKQQVWLSDEQIPEELILQICAFTQLKNLQIKSAAGAMLGLEEMVTDPVDLVKLEPGTPAFDKYFDSGIKLEVTPADEKTDVVTGFLKLSKELLQKLTPADTEYVFEITAGDSYNQTTTANIRIARSETAVVIEDPIVADAVDQDDWQNIKATSVSLTYSLADTYEGTPGIEYSKQGEDNWTFVAANLPSNARRHAAMKAAQKHSLTITGLEPGTAYKYRACCGDFHSDNVMTFQTYSKFIIPNADMEQWAAVDGIGGSNGIKIPTRTGKHDYWGNGNPGAKKAGEVLTDESTDMFNSASKSARLESKFASIMGIGKFAAGNLFIGEYVKTDGTDGVLSFGQPFADFSDNKYIDVHPTALKVHVNYRPGVGVKGKGADSSYIKEGETDQAQIYVALTTAAIDIRTKKSNRKLFNVDDSEVLAYGEHTFTENFGPDGKLQELIIPIEYFSRSNGVAPTHLVIVCSASKYGDFFSGGVGSTMYVDDFELIYE